MTTFSKMTIFIALLLGSVSVFATEAPTNKSLFDELSRHGEGLDIEIETNLDTLFAGKDEEYQKATMRYKTADKEEKVWTFRIRQRGKFRRRVCDIPPLKLEFKKEHLLEAGLQPFDDLKLVTHCLEDDPTAKNNLMREYLAYKLYNEITDRSFRVQLVRITYRNTGKGMGKMKRYGFLIEDVDDVAHRLEGDECECMNMDRNLLNQEALANMHVFQYMIGNADYDLILLRNLKLVTPYDGGEAIVVPYDFDFSGLVNAPYAIPNPDYGIKNVKERVYIGEGLSQSRKDATLEHFRSKKESLLAIVKDFKELNGAARREIRDYLNSFYASIENGLPETGEMAAGTQP